MSQRILFVDDEPNLLSGIRRMLRPLRNEWTTAFAESGPQALSLLEKEPFDVIVSDMRMPGMTGLKLLEEVRNRYPHVVRIILTGQCDKESGLRGLRVAHRMLNKPCDAESLKLTIASTCSLQELLKQEAIVALIGRKDTIASLPTLYRDLMEELKVAEPSFDKIANIIATDIGMLAKLLHVVNSSLYGTRTEITNPRQAVVLLGTAMLRTLALAVGIFSSYAGSDLGPWSIDTLWRHSQATSSLAGAIAKAETEDGQIAELATIAGLLHGVGKLIFSEYRPAEYTIAVHHSVSSRKPLCEVEQEIFGVSHAEVGAALLQLWGLPSAVVEAVAWHHRPSDSLTQSFSPLTAVHVADSITQDGMGESVLDLAYLSRLGLSERVPRWQVMAQFPQEGRLR